MCAGCRYTGSSRLLAQATVAGNGAAWLAYLNSGGVIITEYSITDDVYNEIYATGYGRERILVICSDNAMPSLSSILTIHSGNSIAV